MTATFSCSLPRRRRDFARRAGRRDARGALGIACAPLLSCSLPCLSQWQRRFLGSSSPVASSSRTRWRSPAVQTVRPATCDAGFIDVPSSVASFARSAPHRGGRPADARYAGDSPSCALVAILFASFIVYLQNSRFTGASFARRSATTPLCWAAVLRWEGALQPQTRVLSASASALSVFCTPFQWSSGGGRCRRRDGEARGL